MKTALLVVSIALGGAALGGAVESQAAVLPHVINADRSVAGLTIGRATPGAAVRAFGAPSSRRRTGDVSCVLSWRREGLTLNFVDFSSRPCRDGAIVIATITNRPRWRTGAGLRVGDPVTRVRALYRAAVLHTGLQSGWWLVPRRSCQETGGHAYPGLRARIRHGRVSALIVTAGVCE
jgi:hypothetical protein